MIIDRIKNLHLYTSLHPQIAEVVDFLSTHDLHALDCGKHPLKEGKLSLNIEQIKPKEKTVARLEAHRKFIDIQIPLQHTETMGYTPVELCAEVATPYDEEKDIVFFRGQAQSYVHVEPDMFVLFAPQDAHAPGITPTESKKAVFKVKIQETL